MKGKSAVLFTFSVLFYSNWESITLRLKMGSLLRVQFFLRHGYFHFLCVCFLFFTSEVPGQSPTYCVLRFRELVHGLASQLYSS